MNRYLSCELLEDREFALPGRWIVVFGSSVKDSTGGRLRMDLRTEGRWFDDMRLELGGKFFVFC